MLTLKAHVLDTILQLFIQYQLHYFQEILTHLKTFRKNLVLLLMLTIMMKLSDSFVFDAKIGGLDLYCVMVHTYYRIFGEKCQHLH